MSCIRDGEELVHSATKLLNAIGIAAKSGIGDREFRELVLALLEEGIPATPTESLERPRSKVPLPRRPSPVAVRTEPSPALRPINSTYSYKLFRVKMADGRVTTVSVDPVLATKASQVLGGPKAVSALVRQLAFEYRKGPDCRSCSRFVGRGLQKAILSV